MTLTSCPSFCSVLRVFSSPHPHFFFFFDSIFFSLVCCLLRLKNGIGQDLVFLFWVSSWMERLLASVGTEAHTGGASRGVEGWVMLGYLKAAKCFG